MLASWWHTDWTTSEMNRLWIDKNNMKENIYHLNFQAQAKKKKKSQDTHSVLESLFLSMFVLVLVSEGSWSRHLRDLSVWLKQTTAWGLGALETDRLNPLSATHTSTRPYAPCHVVINLNQSAWGCFEKGAALSAQPICGNVSNLIRFMDIQTTYSSQSQVSPMGQDSL